MIQKQKREAEGTLQPDHASYASPAE
jgi:hypothetical protein